jgi:3-methyladenine DNA glycosylase AlkD
MSLKTNKTEPDFEQTARALKVALFSVSSKKVAKTNSSFFKTGEGEYGEGDVFLGVTVPLQRKIIKDFLHLPKKEIKKMLESEVHEHRFSALIILIERYKKADKKEKKDLVDFYLKNIKGINNWDLVDVSAHKILGDYYVKYGGVNKLYKLAKDKNIWARRIAVVATFAFIRSDIFGPTLKISNQLLSDDEDLIHKAVGWMLREVGKRDEDVLVSFLNENIGKINRTTLRYAIERFSKKKRMEWLRK